MSVYYYLACDEHRALCPACTSVGCGRPLNGTLGRSTELLGPFIYEHQDCKVRIISEHDPESDEYRDVSEPSDTTPAPDSEP